MDTIIFDYGTKQAVYSGELPYMIVIGGDTVPDWEALKAAYIAGEQSYRTLAGEWGVPYATIRDRGSREGWVAAREAYRADVVARTLHRSAASEARDNARKLDTLRRSADILGEMILDVLQDAEQFHRHLIQRGLGEGVSDTEERLYTKADTRAIKDLSAAMRDLASVIRSTYDIPTRQEQTAMDIAMARLELDKGKAAAAAGEGDAEGGVVEITPVLDDTDAQTGEEVD